MLKIKKIKIKKKLADKIEKLLTSDYFGWYYNHTTALKDEDIEPDTFQFTHKFYDDIYNTASYYYQNVLELFHAANIKYERFSRIKSNFLVPSIKGIKHNHIHADQKKNGVKSFLYYVNDSDGDTIFFDNNKKEIKRFTPKKGTGLLFDSNILHAGSNPVKYDKRIVINFIFYE